MPPDFKSVVSRRTISFLSACITLKSSTYTIKKNLQDTLCLSIFGGRERSKQHSNKVTNQNIISNLPYQLCPTHAQEANINIYDLKAYLKLGVFLLKQALNEWLQ